MRSRCFGITKPELGGVPPASAAPAVATAGVAGGGGGVAVVAFAASVGLLGTVAAAGVAAVMEAGSTLIPRSSSLGNLLAWGMLFGLTLRDWAALSCGNNG